MSPTQEKSQLKRALPSVGENEIEQKKPRRSDRIKSQTDAPNSLKQSQLPSPVTHRDSTATEDINYNNGDLAHRSGTVTPPSQIGNHLPPATHLLSPSQFNGQALHSGLSSPPNDTQAYSQFVYPPQPPISYEVEDEEAEGVWGYLLPLSNNAGLKLDALVLRRRAACPVPQSRVGPGLDRGKVKNKDYKKQEEDYEQEKAVNGVPAGGYLIGRHPECDVILSIPTISNRHCILFQENKAGEAVAVLEDLSANGTFINDSIVGRNKRRELSEGDEISILNEARFVFRYARNTQGHGFRQQYSIQEQLGKGHFATVYLCVEKCSGMRFAVKKFEKRSGPGERSKVDGLQQEIAVLMSVSHPALLCLKDTFDEDDGVYLVLELAPEGELFNWIVMKHKLTEDETRRIFIQLFQAVKYLHERNIVHRDIKPENILLVDKELTIKLADFGLAKIIGEESFTTTLCGTPSYVAPEILESSNHRRYTRAVDVWSLGVVLYICLCGFPPFSDELYSRENPYTLSQQIKMGRFDYPSPYWDSVGDAALDLIDRMLTVDVDNRITIDECLEHPWTTNSAWTGAWDGHPTTFQNGSYQNLNPSHSSIDSTEGLRDAMGQLDFSKRKVKRERTLLSEINDVKVARVVPVQNDMAPVKVWEKNYGTQDGAGQIMPWQGQGQGQQVPPTPKTPGQPYQHQGPRHPEPQKVDKTIVAAPAAAQRAGDEQTAHDVKSGADNGPPVGGSSDGVGVQTPGRGKGGKVGKAGTPRKTPKSGGKKGKGGAKKSAKKGQEEEDVGTDGEVGGEGKEVTPAEKRDAREFVEMGGRGDQVLFGDDSGSNYV